MDYKKLSDETLIACFYKLLRNKKSYWNDLILSEVICELYIRDMKQQIKISYDLKLFK